VENTQASLRNFFIDWNTPESGGNIFSSLDNLLNCFYRYSKTAGMKKTIILFAFIAFFSSTCSATILMSPTVHGLPIKANEIYLPVGKTGRLISLMDLSRISVKDFETLAGKKMKFFDKVNFKMGQRELKKSINHDGTFNKKSVEKYLTNPTGPGGGFSFLGLALGFFLSLLGVLIAYVIAGADKRSRVTWAWIGAAISLIILIVILV
jgi:hypothetical protein